MPAKVKAPAAATELNGTDFVWEELRGLRAILNFTKQKSVAREVKDVKNGSSAVDRDGDRLFSRHGDMFRYVEEALLFDDGSAFVCGSVSSWVGTFAEHDDIKVKYYALTPKRGTS